MLIFVFQKETDVKCVEELQKEADMLDETAAYVEVSCINN